MASNVRKNTVRLVFGPGVKVPSYLEVLKFTMNNLKLSAADMHTIYKDENGGQFYVKLVDEESFAAFIADTDEEYIFKFEDGSTAKVTVEQASRIFRYVRIFNLPPEIEDSAIQYVMGQYGTIRQHVRERFPSEMKVDIFNGVRGVHMEVSKEIPAHLYVGHFRARFFYEGLKNKCFFCKAEGHVKQNCPKLAAISTASGSSTQLGAAFLVPVDDRGVSRPYSSIYSRMIETAHLNSDDEISLSTLGRTLTIDFHSMQRINGDAGTTRTVQRKINHALLAQPQGTMIINAGTPTSLSMAASIQRNR
ncbi:hypothetical protein pipiens_019217 [Culex pipiens pipiens]|uniref:CCHC-type domain-containing protein n=1 Tax=Culex pipiens pipiens TaxID=38569 RepID=A0ABD1DZT3_CULPP